MRRFVITALILVLVAGPALAERPWAPGASQPGKSSGGVSLPDIWLRLGPSLVSTNSSRLNDNNEFEKASLKGLDLEAGMTPINRPLGGNWSFSLVIPLVFSPGLGKPNPYGDETALLLMGRIIPTARFPLTLKSGVKIVPYVGAGAGSNLNVFNFGLAKNFRFVKTVRFGADVMLKQSFGIGLGYTVNSLGKGVYEPLTVTDQYGSYNTFDYNPDKSLHLKALTLSLVIKL